MTHTPAVEPHESPAADGAEAGQPAPSRAKDEPIAFAARGIEFAYPDGVTALADVSLEARAGEIVAILGANGSGKTTLLKVLMRLLRPRQGAITLHGTPIEDLPPRELYRRLGMVFQNPTDQLIGATVEQDVAYGPRNLGLSEREIHERVRASLAAVDVLELHGRPIHHLSFGQQKRVCLAGVLAMRPQVLLLDEPTAGLDPAAEGQMIELLLQLNREQGATLVVSTHAVDLLPALAHRVYVLSGGRVWQQGSPREVFGDAPRLAAAGMRPPLVTQLFQEMAAADGRSAESLPLTVGEARCRLAQWFAAARVPVEVRPSLEQA